MVGAVPHSAHACAETESRHVHRWRTSEKHGAEIAEGSRVNICSPRVRFASKFDPFYWDKRATFELADQISISPCDNRSIGGGSIDSGSDPSALTSCCIPPAACVRSGKRGRGTRRDSRRPPHSLRPRKSDLRREAGVAQLCPLNKRPDVNPRFPKKRS